METPPFPQVPLVLVALAAGTVSSLLDGLGQPVEVMPQKPIVPGGAGGVMVSSVDVMGAEVVLVSPVGRVSSSSRKALVDLLVVVSIPTS